jgi:DNA repair exonuclease SbcCD ATPase subunit
MGQTAMYESEAQRLQREADSFTKKFEHEKKRLMVLDDQYRTACEELVEKKESLKKNRPTPAAMRVDQSEIKRLENQLDKALNSYNDLQSGNK